MNRDIRYTGIIVRDHHMLLIQQRDYEGERSYWVAPGGGREPGETEEECVRREMLEETGLEVQVERLLLDEGQVQDSEAYQRFKTYLCSVGEGLAAPGSEPEFEPGEGYEIVAVRWFDLRDETSWDTTVRAHHQMYPFLRRVRMALGYEADIRSLLYQCQWPLIPKQYYRALYEAVIHLGQTFDEIAGILVSGTVVRGNPDPSSDLDLHLLHRHSWRQRLQKWFNEVAVEIFINPPKQIGKYFDEEHQNRRPVTAHMLATGFLMYDPDGEMARLKQEANKWLARQPALSNQDLTFMRYAAATQYEDAQDMMGKDPDTSRLLLAQAVLSMLRFGFAQAGHNEPRPKALLDAYQQVDEQAADLVRAFYQEEALSEKFALAEQIADRTIDALDFFEWESGRENV